MRVLHSDDGGVWGLDMACDKDATGASSSSSDVGADISWIEKKLSKMWRKTEYSCQFLLAIYFQVLVLELNKIYL